MEKQEKQYLLPEDVRNALVNYLATKPYAEVAQVIQALHLLKVKPELKPLEDQSVPVMNADAQ